MFLAELPGLKACMSAPYITENFATGHKENDSNSVQKLHATVLVD